MRNNLMLTISIIIPFFNAEKTLKKCVASILNQHEDNLEIILVNDNSTDNSLLIAKQLASKYSSVIVLDAYGRGVSNARNIGLLYSHGDIIGFCDADDTFTSNAISIIKNFFIKYPNIDIVIGGYRTVFNDNGKDIIKETRRLFWPKILGVKQLAKYIILDNRVMGSVCNKFYRKELLQDCLFDYKLSYCEDMHFNIQVLENNLSSKILITNAVLYNYNINLSSVTNSSLNLFDEDGHLKYFRALKGILTISKSLNIDKYIKQDYFILSMNTLLKSKKFNLTELQQKKLMQEAQKNIKYFILGNPYILFPSNIKRLLYYLKFCKIYHRYVS